MNESRIAHRVARRVQARKETLDLAKIQRLRKDFLLLMKNADRITDYDMAIAWRQYVQNWTNKFETYILRDLMDFINTAKYKQPESERWRWISPTEAIRRKAWDLISEFGVPIYNADDYYSKELRFFHFQKKLPTWKNRVESKARAAWKALNDFVEWHKTNHDIEPVVDISTDEEKMELDGFQVVLRGASASRHPDHDIEVIRRALKEYKAKASKIYPWLVRNMLPVIVDFKMDLDKGGEYKRDRIEISSFAVGATLVHVLAHEMAHHRWATMGDAAQTFWNDMIKGSMGKLDLREVVGKYGEGESWLLSGKIKNDDPRLYYQLGGLNHQNNDYDLRNATSVGDIKTYLEKGGDPIIHVSTKPISAYANKSPMEAFCEALGFLVAYGPSFLLPEVVDWLRTMMPSLRTASRVA